MDPEVQKMIDTVTRELNKKKKQSAKKTPYQKKKGRRRCRREYIDQNSAETKDDERRFSARSDNSTLQ